MSSEAKGKYRISVHGCDDDTSFQMRLTEAEAAVVLKVARRSSKESSYVCQPTVAIRKVKSRKATS